jgi:hypothetical protein
MIMVGGAVPAGAAATQNAPLATMSSLRASQPPRDTRHARKAVIKNGGSGYRTPTPRNCNCR